MRDAARAPRMKPTAVTGTAAIAACAIWALWPLRAITVEPPKLDAPPRNEQHAKPVASLDLAAFHAPLWVAPPPPPAPPAPAAPPPPLKLQLVAILREADAYKAAIYDPDQDRLLVIGKGETIAGRVIEEVRAGDVRLKDNGSSRTLALRDEGDRR